MKKTKEACRILGIHPNTLRRWANTGKIKYVRQPNGNRLYDVDSFLNQGTNNNSKAKIIYARVNSSKQSEDLSNQIKLLRERYPDYELIEDIGSGLSSKRNGFNTLLERIIHGEIGEVVITHKDKLSRFGYNIIDSIAMHNNCKITVLDNSSPVSATVELVPDIVSIINFFSIKIPGLKKYSNMIMEDRELI